MMLLHLHLFIMIRFNMDTSKLCLRDDWMAKTVNMLLVISLGFFSLFEKSRVTNGLQTQLDLTDC